MKRSLSRGSESDDGAAEHGAGHDKYLAADDLLPSTTALTCTFPPLCNRTPTPFRSAEAFEAHYRSHHAFVCQVAVRDGAKCGKLFPNERLLDLHFAELHDPLVAIKQEKGDKIHACFIASCGQRFRTPKARRLHLVDAHQYPKDYFFAVVKYGIEQLLRDGHSGMVRPAPTNLVKDKPMKEATVDTVDTAAVGAVVRDTPPHLVDASSPRLVESSASPAPKQPAALVESSSSVARETATTPPTPAEAEELKDSQMDDLSDLLSATKIDFVPRSVKFGRGGGARGFAKR